MKKLFAFLIAALILTAFAAPAFATETDAAATASAVSQEQLDAEVKESKAMPAALAIGLVAAAGAVGMALTIAKASDGIARQPEAAGEIRTNTMLGLVFIETAIIYALIVAILIIFVL